MASEKPHKPRLRSGFTTGAAAAAAAQAAARGLLTGHFPKTVSICFLTGEKKDISILDWKMEEAAAVCRVIKDAGDDPDITHKAVIGARVRLIRQTGQKERIGIIGGKGVGRVTKPGLEVPPGRAAINPGPEKMIRNQVGKVLRQLKSAACLEVEVFVPEGEALARKTLNPRLGILGGISILGTTGKVTPLSHEAFEATIRAALSVARARGIQEVALTTGRRSERFAETAYPHLPEEAFVQMGDFVELSLSEAGLKGFSRIRLAVMFGKAVKISTGISCTHASKSPMNLAHLAKICSRITADEAFLSAVASANTARHAFDIIKKAHPKAIQLVGRAMLDGARPHCGPDSTLLGTIFDFEGNILFEG